MAFSDDLDSDLISEVSEDYKKAESWLPFAAVEIKRVFSVQELEEARGFMSEMEEAAGDNVTQAKIINKHTDVAAKLLKLGKIIA